MVKATLDQMGLTGKPPPPPQKARSPVPAPQSLFKGGVSFQCRGQSHARVPLAIGGQDYWENFASPQNMGELCMDFRPPMLNSQVEFGLCVCRPQSQDCDRQTFPAN